MSLFPHPLIELVLNPGKYSRPDKNYKTQRLLLGTHTNDEDPNYIMIASVQLPNDNQDIDLRKYEESTNGTDIYVFIVFVTLH